MDIKYKDLIARCVEYGYEEMDDIENGCSFYDKCNSRNVFVNNVSEKNKLSYIYENNIFKYINKDTMLGILNALNENLFLNLNEVVFMVDYDDLEYLEEEYCIVVENNYLGWYNYEYSIVVINFRSIVFNATKHLKDMGVFNAENLNKFLSEQLLVTLIHELGHCICSCEYLYENEIPFNEYSDEEDVVETYAKNIVGLLNEKNNLVCPKFIDDYVDNEEELFDDDFMDE